jgi:hypothetical protein
MDGSHALAEAKSAGAEERCPYELTLATEYLHKARDLAGYARYQDAVRLGRKAVEFAKLAVRQLRSSECRFGRLTETESSQP